jgi:hypothetical protein
MKGTLWECYWELFENAIGNSLRTLEATVLQSRERSYYEGNSLGMLLGTL